MLGQRDVHATIAVRDINRAKQFYEGKLGLTPVASQEPGVLAYKSGASTLLVYESKFAGTNKATAVTWVMDDPLEHDVEALKAKGVAFEHYDFPDMKLEGDVHKAGMSEAAWFKDPDGNILGMVKQ